MKWRKKYYKNKVRYIKEEIKTHKNIDDFKKINEQFGNEKKLSFLDWFLSFIVFGTSPRNYLRFGLFKNHNLLYRNHYVMAERVYFLKGILNSHEGVRLLDSKSEFNEWYKDYLFRKWCVPNNLTKEAFCELFKNSNKLFVKPISGYGGEGAFLVDLSNETLSDAYDRLTRDFEEVIVEEYFSQKGFCNEINPSSLNTIRLVTIRVHDKVVPLSSIFRVGGAGSFVDNIHSGGVGYNVDVLDGTIHEGDGFKESNIKVHPSTGIAVYGKKIPNWDKVIEFASKMHLMAPEGLNFIGWD